MPKDTAKGKRYIDILFFNRQIEELDQDTVVLSIHTRAEGVRNARKIQHWLLADCTDTDRVELATSEGEVYSRWTMKEWLYTLDELNGAKPKRTRGGSQKSNPIEGKQHVLTLFADNEVLEIDSDGLRLGSSARAEILRNGHKVQHELLRRLRERPAELPRIGSDILSLIADNGRLRFRLPVSAIL